MNERLKTAILVSLLFISALAIGTAIYFVFFRPVLAPEAPAEEVAAPPPAALPAAEVAEERPIITPAPPEAARLRPADIVARGGVTQTTEITTSSVHNATLSGDGKGANYYDPSDGRFYRVDAEGNVAKLSDAQFPQVSSADWNGTGDKAVLEFPDGSNIVYDFETEKQVTLPKHWEDFSFSPVSDEIAAKSMAVDPDNRWLVTTNADGSNVRAIQSLGLNADKVIVEWSPNDSVVAFADTAPAQTGGLDRKMILPLGKNNENFKGLVVEGLGFLPRWSADGKRLLYSVAGEYSSNKPLLWITDASPSNMGDNRRSIGLNTWADKCTFSSSTIAYCAVPQNLPDNAGLQRVLFKGLPDSLYKVDLSTGKTSLIAIPEKDVAMENLQVTKDESAIFYSNVDTGHLEKIQLK